MGILVLLLLCLAAVIIKDIYDSTDHSSCDTNQNLRIDAVPIDVQHKIVGTKGHRRVRTTVLFNDGFQYISHKTDVEEHIFSYSISLSSATNAEIIYAAKEAHEKQYLKWREKCGDAKAKDTPLRQVTLARFEVSPSSETTVRETEEKESRLSSNGFIRTFEASYYKILHLVGPYVSEDFNIPLLSSMYVIANGSANVAGTPQSGFFKMSLHSWVYTRIGDNNENYNRFLQLVLLFNRAYDDTVSLRWEWNFSKALPDWSGNEILRVIALLLDVHMNPSCITDNTPDLIQSYQSAPICLHDITEHVMVVEHISPVLLTEFKALFVSIFESLTGETV